MTHRRGFTLIELLVVIAIIALLVSLLMPSLKEARALAKWSICQAHLKQVGTAMLTYVPDNEDWMPGYARGGGVASKGYEWPRGSTYTSWYQSMLMTLWHKSGNYPDPPRNGDGILQPYSGGSKGGLNAILTCPSIKKGPTRMMVSHAHSYWMDYIWGEKGFGLNVRGTTTWDNGSYVPIPVGKIDVPVRLTYMAESLGFHAGIYHGYWGYTEGVTSDTPTARHFDNYDMVFCDGHVETGPIETFYQPEYWQNPNTRGKGG